MTDPKETELEDLFAMVREETLEPSGDLMARVLADAAKLQPAEPVFAVATKSSRWESFLEMIGGWPALSGVAAAGVAGVWLGIAPPTGLEQLTSDVLGTGTSVSLISDVGGLVGDIADG